QIMGKTINFRKMISAKQLLPVFLLSIVLFQCKPDEEQPKTQGTVREITDDTTPAEKENGREQNTEMNETAGAVKITQLQDYYVHLEGDDRSPVAEMKKFGENISLMLSFPESTASIALNGKMGKDSKAVLKGITDENDIQHTFELVVVSNSKIKLTNKTNGKTYELKQNFDNGLMFEAYVLDKKVETLTDKAELFIPQNEKNLQQIIFRNISDQRAAEPEAFLKTYHKIFLKEFKELGDDGFWARELSSDILYNARGILAYGIHSYSYSGGAHGNGASNYIVYDTDKKRELQLDDIFSAADKSKLAGIIYESIKKNREFSDEDMKAEYDLPIKLTDNFYFTPKGIHFYYNAYDLTSFVMGPDDVFIPIGKIKKALDTDFFNNLML
ncbi:MAG: DUF3298 domain-containing protein, partial [Bacteroidota bacterium]|nr:DUF3298 domain-containing protein [Bacteroidota bacterium]